MTTLYRIFDSDRRLLYIGIADNVLSRLGQHRSSKEWWSEVSSVQFEEHPDRATAERAERDAIQRERPLHNIVHNRSARTLERAAHGRPQRHAFESLDSLLVGHYVLTPHPSGDRRRAQYQGYILGRVDETTYLVQWFSWFTGEPTDINLVDIEDMALDENGGWRFYSTQAAFLDAAERCTDYALKVDDEERAST